MSAAKGKGGDGGAHGIDVHAAMAWLFGVIFGKKAATPPPVPESSDPTFFAGGTPNMKLLYSTCRYVFAVLTRSADLPVHRARIGKILSREKLCHGQGEPTSSSHGQLWVAGMAATLLIASEEDHEELVDLATAWFRVEHAIHRVCEIAGDMWCAGSRGLMGGKPFGSNTTRPKLWAAITTGKVPGKSNQYDLGAWCMSRVPEAIRKAIQVWPESFPPMFGGPFHAARFEGGDFYSWYEVDPKPRDFVRSAGVLNGEKWISEDIDREKIGLYASRAPVLIPSGIEAGEVKAEIDAEKGEPG